MAKWPLLISGDNPACNTSSWKNLVISYFVWAKNGFKAENALGAWSVTNWIIIEESIMTDNALHWYLGIPKIQPADLSVLRGSWRSQGVNPAGSRCQIVRSSHFPIRPPTIYTWSGKPSRILGFDTRGGVAGSLSRSLIFPKFSLNTLKIVGDPSLWGGVDPSREGREISCSLWTGLDSGHPWCHTRLAADIGRLWSSW